MAKNSLFVRISTPDGHFSVPSAVAAREGSDWTVLKQEATDDNGRPLAPKPREDVAAPKATKRAARPRKPRTTKRAAASTPTKPGTPVSADPKENA